MQKLKLNVNWFFVASATASYLLGVIIASWSGLAVNILTLIAGLIIFYAFTLLQELQRFLTPIVSIPLPGSDLVDKINHQVRSH